MVYEPKEAEHWPKSLDARNYTAERAVTRAADAGATCMKAYVESGFGSFSWPYLQTDTLQKIQIAAKQHNLVLIVHANSVDSWRSALDAHADIIAHGLWVWPGEPGDRAPPSAVSDVIAAVAHTGTCVQPTLQTVAGERAMIDARLLDDPRLTWALPKGVIAYLRSAEGVKARTALLEQYRKASPPAGLRAVAQDRSGTNSGHLEAHAARPCPPCFRKRYTRSRWLRQSARTEHALRKTAIMVSLGRLLSFAESHHCESQDPQVRA